MIEVIGCRVTFPSQNGQAPLVALDNVDLTIQPLEFVCVLGPSGCGKTTLLKVIAGLLRADEGEVRINGKPVSGPGNDRAMVFQDFALLPWVNVVTNVGFGLELRGIPKGEREQISRDLIRVVGLEGFEHHYPRQLSGGMQQRVGLARALAVNPDILLMDEPYGSVDAQTRRLMQEDLMALLDRQKKTVLFVTHSVEEAVLLGDRVVLMTPRPGRVFNSIDVELPRPRPADIEKQIQFGELKDYLWHQLKDMND